MKTFFTFTLFYLFLANLTFAQTFADPPGPENVLVVYRIDHTYSGLIKDHYVDVREIPSTHVTFVRLDETIQYGVTIENENEQISGEGNAAWIYTKEKIADPIEQHLNTTYYNNQLLRDIVRYVVLCKGIPHRINDTLVDDGTNLSRKDVTVDALLCLINQENGINILDMYGTGTASAISNPYLEVDPLFSLEYRFISNYFEKNGWRLQYLVSRLDGDNYQNVISMIDRGIDPDLSGDKWWILDHHIAQLIGSGHVSAAYEKMNEVGGFNINSDATAPLPLVNEPIISNVSGQVIGYVSHGVHSGLLENYILDSLEFTYANGAIFNSVESYNGASFGYSRLYQQGLISDFINVGGTAGGGNAWEPLAINAYSSSISFPAYGLGYNIVDAIWMGYRNIGYKNVVVGDPLTRIYDCPATIISTNTTIGSGDYTCDIVIEENATLTISTNSIVNFDRNAKLLVYGTLELEDSVTLNFDLYSRFYLEGNLTLNGNPACINFNDDSRFKTNNFSVDNSLTITFNDDTRFYLNEEGTLTTHSGNLFVFNDNSIFYSNGRLIVNEGNSLNFNNSSFITVKNKIYLTPGAELDFYDNSRIYVDATLISQGEPGNNVIFNFSNFSNQFNVNGGDTLLIDFTTINNSGIKVEPSQPEPMNFTSITNSLFESPDDPIFISGKAGSFGSTVIISNCNVNNCPGIGIGINQVPEIIVEDNLINISSEPGTGINLTNNGIVNIINCEITGGAYGISSYTSNNAEEDTIEYRTDLESDISIRQCDISSQTGILFDVDTELSPISTLKIKDNQLSQCRTAIMINRFGSFIPEIKANTITGNSNGSSRNGIVLTNGGEIHIYHNDIFTFLTGINLNIVTTPHILENNISAIDLTVEPYSGIISVSSNGEIRKNTIQYHSNGIELGSSSPRIGANIITDNDYYGIYISDNSHPDLSEAFVGEEQYPLSGYNTIRENGVCNLINYSELYLVKSTVNLLKGCNTIADDREDPMHCGYYYLIDGEGVEKDIQANRNYWGEVNGSNPEGRFGESLTVIYDDWLEDPCTYDEGETELILANSKGEVYDTVYSTGITSSGLTDIETRYAAANEFYYSNQYLQAKQECEGIIQNYGSNIASLQAYNSLYSLANLTNSTPATFSQLRDFYLQQADDQSDSVMIGALTHLSDLCLVSAEEYITAITNFDQIVQQNPNTDVALYRQIDALTTALLLTQDSTLNKGMFVKYSVNGLSDYADKLSELLRTRGKSGLASEEELLPTEYTLYQNYPNPFNPNTTIKYDLPTTSDVSLIIYDILGRKVKEPVHTKQQAGRYEVQFNASSLSSGVYIYQLIAEKFISSKKMILLK